MFNQDNQTCKMQQSFELQKTLQCLSIRIKKVITRETRVRGKIIIALGKIDNPKLVSHELYSKLLTIIQKEDLHLI